MTAVITSRSDHRVEQEDPDVRQIRISGNGWEREFPWHDPTRLGSAAFWVEETRKRHRPETYRVGSTLAEEVALCLLGGYGINEAMATGAFAAVRDAGLLNAGNSVSPERFESVLTSPMSVAGHVRPVRYRFPRQRALRLSSALTVLAEANAPDEDQPRHLRDWLMALPGVGPKTASWIVRNRTRSDSIAVIDIHIRRAGVFAEVFDPAWRLSRDYGMFEEAFCAWARVGEVPTADMDATIWSALSSLGNAARLIFAVERLTDLD